MSGKTTIGFEILRTALVVGILGDILLRQTPWGLNVLLFNLAFTAGLAVLLVRRKREYLTKQTAALMAAQIFFAAMFVWRDTEALLVADAAAIIAIMSVLFVPKMNVPARFAGVFHYIAGFVWSALNAVFAGVALLGFDIKWKSGDRSAWAKNTISAVRGLLIAAPILLVFGALFMAADAAYQGLIERVIYVNPEKIFSHAILTAVFAWATAGYLRGILLGEEPNFPVSASETAAPAASAASKVEQIAKEPDVNPSALPDGSSILEHINRSDPPNDPQKPRAERKAWNWSAIDSTMLPNAFTLGAVETGMVLGLINLLFLSFVIVQLPYLFGGIELVQNTPDFKLAEYARRGFGELVAVAALVLPILLVSHWLLRRDNPMNEKLYRGLAGVQIALLFVIMASAGNRLMLLTGNLGYGLTAVRLYSMIFMIWLAVVFVWFALTVLRGSRQYFAWGALWSAFVVLGATHVLNPEDLIVRTNVRLMTEGRPFDPKYVTGLSDDAVPALLNAIPQMSPEQQCTIKRRLSKRFTSAQAEGDLRSFNLSRRRAFAEMNEGPQVLDPANCAAPPSSQSVTERSNGGGEGDGDG
jgi:hypothetical protein